MRPRRQISPLQATSGVGWRWAHLSGTTIRSSITCELMPRAAHTQRQQQGRADAAYRLSAHTDTGSRMQKVVGGMSRKPSHELRSFEPVSDITLLAAIDRAERHSPAEGVQRGQIAEHLGFAHVGGTTVGLRPQFERLTADGAIRCFHIGRGTWGLTSTGRKRLTRARRAGVAIDVPEATQHWRWRQARAEAAERIDDLREAFRGSLAAGQLLLEDEPAAGAWVELAERLQQQCMRLAAATYCLNEWIEPDGARADVDGVHRQLRNIDLANAVS